MAAGEPGTAASRRTAARGGGGTGGAAGTGGTGGTGGVGRADRAAEALPVQARLLAVASALFAERGFAQTSVQDIVERAGVTKGAMYHYYTSKDDLLQQIYTRLLALQAGRLDGIAAGPGPVRDRLQEAAADVVVTTLEHLDDAVVSMRSMHMLPEERQAAIRSDRRRYHERFRGLVVEGQRDGVFRPEPSADLVTHQFFGGVHHLGTWYHADGELAPYEIGATFADLLLRGLDRD